MLFCHKFKQTKFISFWNFDTQYFWSDYRTYSHIFKRHHFWCLRACISVLLRQVIRQVHFSWSEHPQGVDSTFSTDEAKELRPHLSNFPTFPQLFSICFLKSKSSSNSNIIIHKLANDDNWNINHYEMKLYFHLIDCSSRLSLSFTYHFQK